jgi:hypothetical protein
MPTVIVGTEAGLFRLGDSNGIELEDRNVSDIALRADGPLAIADASAVLRRSPAGVWDVVTSVEGRRLNCLRPAQSAVFIGTDHAHLLGMRGASAEPLSGFEEAPGRADWYTPWGGPPDVRSIAAGGDSLYVNVHVGGILRSDDGGATWSPTIDIHSDVHEVIVAGDDAETVLAATAWGLAISRNGGESWDFDDDGLHATYARAVALSGDRILMTSSLGPRGGDAGIFRRSLGTAGFEKIHTGLPEWFPQNVDTGCVAARNGIVSLGTGDGRVFLSEDHGDSWEQIGEGLPPVNKVLLDPTGL